MKTKQAYIFVDDGDPEASDFENNFICYYPAIPGSYEQAVAKAKLGPWKMKLPGSRSHVPYANALLYTSRHTRPDGSRPYSWNPWTGVVSTLRRWNLGGAR